MRAGMNSHRSMWARISAAALSLWCLVVGQSTADVFVLAEGDQVEGEVVSEQDGALRIRTPAGIFEIESDRIVERRPAPSPWERYEKEQARRPKTAKGFYDLSRWCRENGLRGEQLENLRKVIELDPGHAEARAALGYLRQDGKWVKPKKRAKGLSDEERESRRRAKKEEKLIRDLVAEWHVKVQAIYRGRLEGQESRSERFRDGRSQILEIRDPLAIPGLTKVLSQGGAEVRRLLVEALSHFDVDEATMNLLVVAVLDPDATVRDAAATELIGRDKDGRVVGELRGALSNEEEFILRNAASALGVLKAKPAVPDLISVLSTVERQRVRVCYPVFLDGIYNTFGGFRRYHCGGRYLLYQPLCIGVIGPTYPVGTLCSFESRLVSVYRTEVQEALISITGQNFGFDEAAWRRWWRQQEK